MTSRQLVPVILLLALLGPACGGGSDAGTGPVSTEPTGLAFNRPPSAAQSRGAFGNQPLVQLVTRGGEPVKQAGVVVTVTVDSGPPGVLFGDGQATTSDQGEAAFAGLGLQGRSGVYRLRFDATGLTGATARVLLEAGAAALIAPVTPESVTVVVGREILPRPAVKVMDQDSNGVSSASVRFQLLQGGGTVQGNLITANSSGVAAVAFWGAGTVAGPNRLVASALSGTIADTFLAVAIPEPPATIRIDAGANQAGPAGTVLPIHPTVVLADQYGNPVPGVTVQFAAFLSHVADSVQVTDSAGRAMAGTWSLGTQTGLASVMVTVAAAPRVFVNISAIILPGPPATLSFTGADPDSVWLPTDASLGQLSFALRDQFGNAVPGVTVAFSASSGGSAFAGSMVTDAAGMVVQPSWHLGPAPGLQTLTVSSGAVTLTRTVRSHAGRLLRTVAGDSQPVVVGAMAAPPVVRLTDSLGVGVPGVPVAFHLPRGAVDGVLAPPDTVMTAADGSVTAPAWRVGLEVLQGSSLVAVVNGLAQVVITTRLEPDVPVRLVNPRAGKPLSGFVGTAVDGGGDVRVEDRYGNGVPGLTVDRAVVSGAATLGSATATDSTGVAHQVVTLPTQPGSIRLRATAAALPADTVLLDLTALPGPFDHFEVLGGDGQQGPVRKQLPASLRVRLVDRYGNPMPGLDVVYQAASGGKVTTSFPVSDTLGVAGTQWVLGPFPGTQTATVTRTGQTTTFTATATPATPVALNLVGGTNQSVRAGSTAPVPLVVQLNDADGFGAAGAEVDFAVTSGSGSLGTASATTDSGGRARISGWTLGAGPNQVTATVAGAPGLAVAAAGTGQPAVSSFNITLNFASTPTAAVQSAFANAASRWSQVIVGDIPDQPVVVPANACYDGQGAFSTTVDDLLLYVLVVPIDGAGGILGGTGVCVYRASGLPAVAVIELDRDDLLAFPAFVPDIVLHEMGHALGVGPSWQLEGLVQGAGGATPLFTGAAARQGYWAVRGATGGIPGGVPLETQGGQGTRDVHWAESNFRNELMTGYIDNPPNPLSLVTSGSLQDLGYQVDNAAADLNYVTAGLRTQGARTPVPFREAPWTRPSYEAGPDGTLRPH